jgi:hypothetical protein
VPFAVLADEAAAWPSKTGKEQGYQFRGYKLDAEERPTFLYTYGQVAVEEFPNALGPQGKPAVVRKFTLTGAGPDGKLYYRAAAAPSISEGENGWYMAGAFKTKIDGGAKPVIRKVGGNQELLLPIDLSKKKAEFIQTIEW